MLNHPDLLKFYFRSGRICEHGEETISFFFNSPYCFYWGFSNTKNVVILKDKFVNNIKSL